MVTANFYRSKTNILRGNLQYSRHFVQPKPEYDRGLFGRVHTTFLSSKYLFCKSFRGVLIKLTQTKKIYATRFNFFLNGGLFLICIWNLRKWVNLLYKVVWLTWLCRKEAHRKIQILTTTLNRRKGKWNTHWDCLDDIMWFVFIF